MHTQWKPLTVVVLNNNSHCTTAWSPPAHQASSTPVAIVLTMDDKKCFISEWDLSSFHGGGREGRTRRNQAHFQQFKNKVNSQINTTCSQGNYQKNMHDETAAAMCTRERMKELSGTEDREQQGWTIHEIFFSEHTANTLHYPKTRIHFEIHWSMHGNCLTSGTYNVSLVHNTHQLHTCKSNHAAIKTGFLHASKWTKDPQGGG